jgi:hypothetical protein
MDNLQNVPVDKKFSIREFCESKNYTYEAVKKMIQRNSLPEQFTVVQLSPRKRIIVEKEALNSKPKYIHPSELPADAIVKINNFLQDEQFIKPSGKPNIKKIAEYVNQHYWTIKRFIENDYKEPDEARADKGISRKFKSYKKNEIKRIKRSFEHHFQRNAQKNIQQAIREVKRELGEKIPVRLATEWTHSLLGTHTMKHYYKTFIKQFTPHIRRDLWAETENFLDVVEVDVWKIDVPFVDDEYKKKIDAELAELKSSNNKSWEKQRTKACQAECLAFIDRKTRYPLQILICPHSVSGQDVKKGLMLLIKEWGLFKQLYIDNGREFFNKDVIDFLYGIFEDEFEIDARTTNIKVVELKQEERVATAAVYSPYGKAIVERTFKQLKDSWAVYHDAYSPNQQESRKPTLQLSAVQPTLDFNELAKSLMEFIFNKYIYEERPEMYLNPGRTKAAEENQDRPKSIDEAFQRAYASPSFERRDVDSYLLAYHYAEKMQGTFREGVIRVTYKSYILRLIPDNIESMFDYANKKKALTVIINPSNIFEAWLFDGKKKITRAEDPRFNNEMGVGLDRANYIQKIQNKVVRASKRKMKLIDEYEAVQKTERVNNKFSESDFNPEVDINESIEYESRETYSIEDENNTESHSIWDLDD